VDQGEALELLLEAGEAQVRSCNAVKGQGLQATIASLRGLFASPKVSKTRPLALLGHVGGIIVLVRAL
jgi:hypothetical protein